MDRVQLALNVDDLDTSIAFYSRLFDTPPAKKHPGYANFAVAHPPLKLVLIENPGQGGTINHLGIEVDDADAVDAIQTRLAGDGLTSLDERATVCCYAKQDKFWVENSPNGEQWEVYTVLADSSTYGTDGAVSALAAAGKQAPCCDSATDSEATSPAMSEPATTL